MNKSEKKATDVYTKWKQDKNKWSMCDVTSSSSSVAQNQGRGYFWVTTKIPPKFNERYKFTDPLSSMKS